MKKLSILVAALAAFVFTGCDEAKDDNPVLATHEEAIEAEFLNEPVMQNQYIDFTEADAAGSLHLTCSQPEGYGYAASARYQVQVSLTKDFADFRNVSEPFRLCSAIDPVNGDIAGALCELYGVKTEADLANVGYAPLYVRLKADIYTDLGAIVPGTTYISNVVEFKHVKVSYLAIIVPGQPSVYYMRGSWSEGWDAMPEYNFLTTDEKNVWEISELNLPYDPDAEKEEDKGKPLYEFKVADANWGAVNLGAGEAEIVPGTPYVLFGGDNPGNITVKAPFKGKATLTLKNGAYTLLLTPAN